jgi:DNA modification methylase
LKIEWIETEMPLKALKEYGRNPRRMTKAQFESLVKSIKQDGYHQRLIVNQDGTIIGGHQRKKALKEAGYQSVDKIPVLMPSRQLNEEEFKRLNVRDNLPYGEFDFDMLTADFDIDELKEWGMPENLLPVYNDDGFKSVANGCLIADFGIPPFSIFDCRQGYWKERKKEWIKRGVVGEIGRKDDLIFRKSASKNDINNAIANTAPTTSVFDPVLTEVLYGWFAKDGSVVIDPFAGGITRGAIASIMNLKYVGVDISPDQIKSNENIADKICPTDNPPFYILGDSKKIDVLAADVEADFIISCPPYLWLERYSDDPNDLSNLSQDEFYESYEEIIKKTCGLLKNNRFACFVVGEVRDKNGNYVSFIPKTIEAFENAGLSFYNEIILVNSLGSAALRCRGQFEASRKLVKVHQNVLIFVKGSAKEATKYLGKPSLVNFDFKEDEENHLD